MPTLPSTRVAPVTDTPHGEAITDPYRRLDGDTAAVRDPRPGRDALRERELPRLVVGAGGTAG